MNQLIEALQIFMQYTGHKTHPTHCEHDVLLIVGVTEEQVSEDDKDRLKDLGFRWIPEHDCWGSSRFGSA